MAITTPLYLTKYALSKGVIEIKPAQVDQRYSDEKSIKVIGYFDNYYMGKDIFVSPDEAKKVAEQMRDKRIESLKKQLSKLEKLMF